MKSIVILGGGTAGWITANLMAYHWNDRDLDIRLGLFGDRHIGNDAANENDQ